MSLHGRILGSAAFVSSLPSAVRSFPSNLTATVFGYQPKTSFTVEDEKTVSAAPKVEFSAPPGK